MSSRRRRQWVLSPGCEGRRAERFLVVEGRGDFQFFFSPPLAVTLTASQQAARSFPRSAGWQLAFFQVDTHAPGFPSRGFVSPSLTLMVVGILLGCKAKGV